MPNYGSLLKTTATVYDLLAVSQKGVRDSEPELAALQGAGKYHDAVIIVIKASVAPKRQARNSLVHMVHRCNQILSE
jgi:hypothetical protein